MTADTITIPCVFSCRNSGILALLLYLVLLTAAPYAANGACSDAGWKANSVAAVGA